MEFIIGAIFGAFVACVVIVVPAMVMEKNATAALYKHTHCKHIDSRVEYQKCFDEFKPEQETKE